MRGDVGRQKVVHQQADLTNIPKCGIKAQLSRGNEALKSRGGIAMMIQALDSILIALVLVLLVELLGIRERMAVGRVQV